MRTDQPTAVYRLYDSAGALLYVGVTSNPDARFGAHSLIQPWWAQVAARDVTWYPTRTEGKAAEAEAVRTENPLHNRRLRAEALTVTVCIKVSEAEAAAIDAARGDVTRSAWVRAAILATVDESANSNAA